MIFYLIVYWTATGQDWVVSSFECQSDETAKALQIGQPVSKNRCVTVVHTVIQIVLLKKTDYLFSESSKRSEYSVVVLIGNSEALFWDSTIRAISSEVLFWLIEILPSAA